MNCESLKYPPETKSAGFEVSEAALLRFQRLVETHCGVANGIDSALFVARRLEQRCKDLGCDTLERYNEILAHEDPENGEIGIAVDLVTTHETYFFRELRQLEVLCVDLLERRILRSRPDASLALWSAGCSSGEEVYSLSMLLDQYGLYRRDRCRIFGSDISKKAIKRAREAVYRRSSLRTTTPEQRERFFVPEGEDAFRVKAEFREMCHFRVQNLIYPCAECKGNLDVILCRNVLMYLSASVRQQVIQHFWDKLSPGGFLLLGRAESLVNVNNPFTEIRIDQELVYHKAV